MYFTFIIIEDVATVKTYCERYGFGKGSPQNTCHKFFIFHFFSILIKHFHFGLDLSHGTRLITLTSPEDVKNVYIFTP